MGQPTIAINANFFDVRGRRRAARGAPPVAASPLGAFVDNTHGQGRANEAVTGTVAYPGKQGLSGGGESWSALSTMILPYGWRAVCVAAQGNPGLRRPPPRWSRTCSTRTRSSSRCPGSGCCPPAGPRQLHDPGPSAARTALAYAKQRDEMYVFEGGSYTPDNIQDLFRGLGSDTAILLDGGGSSAIVLRRDTGGMWAGAGSPGDPAIPARCSATRTSAGCPAGWRSTSRSAPEAGRSAY